MNDQISIDLSGDPQLRAEIVQMQGLVEHATSSHVIRAAIRYFSESSAEYEREVYIREQLEFDQQGTPFAGNDDADQETAIRTETCLDA